MLRRRDDGNALITTILVSMIIGVLASLTLSTGRQAVWSSTSDRNRQVSLGVAPWHGVLEQIRRAAAHVLAHLRLGERTQPMHRSDVINAGSDGLITVDEGAVEIEDDSS